MIFDHAPAELLHRIAGSLALGEAPELHFLPGALGGFVMKLRSLRWSLVFVGAFC